MYNAHVGVGGTSKYVNISNQMRTNPFRRKSMIQFNTCKCIICLFGFPPER